MKYLNSAVFDSNVKRWPILATGLAFTYLITRILAITLSGTETESTAPQATVAQNHVLQTPQDFSLISNFHLFGQPDSASSSVAGLVPESTQQLKLKGVLYLLDHQAYAIIESSDQTQKTYRIHDSLPGGAILQTIETNRIIIMADNQQESLALNKTKPEQTQSAVEEQDAVEEQPVSESDDEIVIQPLESLSNY